MNLNLIDWEGGEMPVDGSTLILAVFRDGYADIRYAARACWTHTDETGDIIAYLPLPLQKPIAADDARDGEMPDLTLKKMLAIEIGAYDDFSDEHLKKLISIGQGMFWSEQFDIAARDLAAQVDNEFDGIMSMNAAADDSTGND